MDVKFIMPTIAHAVIPVAGFGTRMLPLSKAVPKELLPLGNKPAIQYVIEEAIAAGITNIVLVNHAQKTAIENYFDINSELDTQLRAKGKNELADSLNWLPDGDQCPSRQALGAWACSIASARRGRRQAFCGIIARRDIKPLCQ